MSFRRSYWQPPAYNMRGRLSEVITASAFSHTGLILLTTFCLASSAFVPRPFDFQNERGRFGRPRVDGVISVKSQLRYAIRDLNAPIFRPSSAYHRVCYQAPKRFNY